MADKGYYYLKLREDFFDTDELRILESMENGYLYSNILLKLYLKALKNGGKLTFNEFIPYNVKMLATITGHNVDVIEKAIKIFQSMHLIEILDNGAIYMMDMQKMIGSISNEGVRKAEYRERIKLEKEQIGTKLGQSPDIISISNSISNIFNYWNDNNIIRHKELNKETQKAIEKALKNYKEEEIKEYIDRYNKVLKDKDWYFDTKWTLAEFLKQQNGISAFTDEGSKWVSYNNKKTKKVNNKNNSLYEQRTYTKEQLESVYVDIDDIEM